VVATPALAQEPRFAFSAPASDVTVTRNVQYGSFGDHGLMLDLYRRSSASGKRLPALIFFNRAMGADRSGEFYAAWAKEAASRDLVAILPDLRDGNEAQDFGLVVRHVVQHASELGIDSARIAVYAASGNVYSAFPAIEDPAQTSIKAAVMYYGTAPITEFRRDLPVLYVRAGLDRPEVNRDIVRLTSLAVSQNAPVTLLNHPTGYHGFEFVNDDDASRDIIARTIDFVKRATAPSFLAAMRQSLPEATAAGYVLNGKFHEAATIYAELVGSRPDDSRLRLSYGEALLGDAQYAAACTELEKLKGKGLGYRDLGLPAARACMQKGDPDKAIEWLKSIPSRFLPPQIQNEPVFAALKDRADFRALFQGR
jgi:hypothetical protein